MSEGDRDTGSVAGRNFSTVLDAEAQAEARLAEMRAEVDRLCLEAQAEARRIAARADRRLEKLHRAEAGWTSAQRAALVAAFEAEARAAPQGYDAGRIAMAAKRLARRLIGMDGS